ncbi:MAG: nucleoside triphosphate pyrophosphohydrolase, partial [Spirochaetaceae bacterium]
YETVDAINSGDFDHIREELGDAFMMLTMLSVIYEEDGRFSIDDIMQEVSEKLIRRHPHVFSNSENLDAGQIAMQWEEIKEKVEGRKKDSVLDKVSHSLPPLERAWKMQKKAAKSGFDWNNAEPVWDKIAEELAETREAWNALEKCQASQEHLEEELGDLLFSVVNVARFLNIDPAVALQRSNSKFDRRFRQVEAAMKTRGHKMGPESFNEMDQLWEDIKQIEKTDGQAD